MKKQAGLVCAIVLAIISTISLLTVSGQTSDPSTLPLLSSDGLQYLGAFRLPTDTIDGVNFTYGGNTMAFNPATNSLFISAYGDTIAEVSIPALVQSSNAGDLNRAMLLQPFADPSEGHIVADFNNRWGNASLTGLMVYGNRLIGTATLGYDANGIQRLSHFSRSLQLNQPSFSGWSAVWQAERSGYVSGFMTPVPSQWQAKLGGPALTGQCCVSIAWRTSNGPAAFAFDPANVGQPVVDASPLVYYTITPGQATLGQWGDDGNPTWSAAAYIRGMAVIENTRSVLYFGKNGLGPYCYGYGTADPALIGTVASDGVNYCADAGPTAKGQHNYPYRYQVWAYDLNDLAAVKAGAKQPWQIVPYGVWPLSLPTPSLDVRMGGVAYDAARQIVYVAQLAADQQSGFAEGPVIHAFRLSATPGANDPPNTVSAVSVTTDRPAPQMAGTPITFTAQPTGGVAPYQYKWIASDGSDTTVAAPWSASNRVTWTPPTANANYRISVWVRSAGNTVDALEASTTLAFPIIAATMPTTTSVAQTANRVAPQAPMTAITWTATPTGGVGPHQYKWRIFDGTAWTVGANWSTTNAFVWTPATANANYRAEVWVRSAGNTADAQEASTATAFPIENLTASVLPDVPSVPSVPSAPSVASVALAANKPAPQVAGTSITFTATPSGGTGPFLYKWSVSGASPVTMAWVSFNVFTWTPTTADNNYRVRVWVKNIANTADQPEASTEQAFAITAVTTPPPVTSTPPPSTSTPVSSVAVSANLSSPQGVGAAITFTATPSGGTGPFLYKWSVSGGAAPVTMGWVSMNVFTWTPTTADNYRISVSVKSASNTADAAEAASELAFVTTSAAP